MFIAMDLPEPFTLQQPPAGEVQVSRPRTDRRSKCRRERALTAAVRLGRENDEH
jgi:hypothetical protein